MIVLRSRNSLKKYIQGLKKSGKEIGFVPTMGYLHAGHLSLLKKASRQNDIVIGSLFVNPLQFGPKEDLKRYPRDFKRDRALFAKEGADVLFAPEPEEFYPKDFQTQVQVKEVSRGLCGLSRPHHFGGVATVVLKLLNLVQPDRLYLGQKDFQQIRVIEQMVADMDLSVKIIRCPTFREPDGLAMSSRNVFLEPKERLQAPYLYKALKSTAQLIKSGEKSTKILKKHLIDHLKKVSMAQIDYAEIVDAASLRPMVELTELPRRSGVLVAAALIFPKARLIDNLIVKVRYA